MLTKLLFSAVCAFGFASVSFADHHECKCECCKDKECKSCDKEGCKDGCKCEHGKDGAACENKKSTKKAK